MLTNQGAFLVVAPCVWNALSNEVHLTPSTFFWPQVNTNLSAPHPAFSVSCLPPTQKKVYAKTQKIRNPFPLVALS